MRGGRVRRRCMLGYTDYFLPGSLCRAGQVQDAWWKREAALHAGVH
jgi:hypothetical protein